MDKTINQRIAYYRKLRCLSQAQVAEAVGMKSSTYSQCERQGKIPCGLLIKLSKVLDVSCNTLLFGTEDAPLAETPEEPEVLSLTNSEISVIKVLRSFSPQKRTATFQIIQNIWKGKLNPFKVLEKI